MSDSYYELKASGMSGRLHNHLPRLDPVFILLAKVSRTRKMGDSNTLLANRPLLRLPDRREEPKRPFLPSDLAPRRVAFPSTHVLRISCKSYSAATAHSGASHDVVHQFLAIAPDIRNTCS